MKIYNYWISNLERRQNHDITFDLYHKKRKLGTVTADSSFLCVDLQNLSESDRTELENAGKKLKKEVPQGIADVFRYDDVGLLGLSIDAAYPEGHGSAVYLLEQAVRLYEYERISKERNKAIVVYKILNEDFLKKVSISREKLDEYLIDIIEHRKGIVTFIGNKEEDFEINEREE